MRPRQGSEASVRRGRAELWGPPQPSGGPGITAREELSVTPDRARLVLARVLSLREAALV